MIEGWVAAAETMPDLSAATAALARRRPAARSAEAPAPAALPFDLFREEEALVRGWRRLEETASLPMQSFAFASALASTLLADALIHVFHIREGDEVAALLALCRAP